MGDDSLHEVVEREVDEVDHGLGGEQQAQLLLDHLHLPRRRRARSSVKRGSMGALVFECVSADREL